jgi:hypothetical protein
MNNSAVQLTGQFAIPDQNTFHQLPDIGELQNGVNLFAFNANPGLVGLIGVSPIDGTFAIDGTGVGFLAYENYFPIFFPVRRLNALWVGAVDAGTIISWSAS